MQQQWGRKGGQKDELGTHIECRRISPLLKEVQQQALPWMLPLSSTSDMAGAVSVRPPDVTFSNHE